MNQISVARKITFPLEGSIYLCRVVCLDDCRLMLLAPVFNIFPQTRNFRLIFVFLALNFHYFHFIRIRIYSQPFLHLYRLPNAGSQRVNTRVSQPSDLSTLAKGRGVHCHDGQRPRDRLPRNSPQLPVRSRAQRDVMAERDHHVHVSSPVVLRQCNEVRTRLQPLASTDPQPLVLHWTLQVQPSKINHLLC